MLPKAVSSRMAPFTEDGAIQVDSRSIFGLMGWRIGGRRCRTPMSSAEGINKEWALDLSHPRSRLANMPEPDYPYGLSWQQTIQRD